MQFSPRVDRLSGEGVAAWAIHKAAMAARRRGEDVILLSVGDPDFSTPPAVVQAAAQALAAGDTHYSDIAGRPALRAAIARNYLALGGPPAGPGNVIALAGAQNALFAASLCLFSPGDEVLVPEPMYVTYPATVGASGAELVPVSPLPESGFRPDLAALERAVTPRTRAILLANPSNPTGVVLTRAELEGIAAIAGRHDLWVISDEVYAALAFEAPHVCIAALPGMRERTVTVGSLSKSHAMTGWRLGWMIGPEPLIRHAENLSLCMLYGLPGFIQEAAVAALDGAGEAVAEMRAIYRRRRDLVHAALSGVPGLAAAKPDAGMFLLVDVRGVGLPAADFAWGLFRQEGVSVLDATAFGTSAAGFVRISFASGEDELRDGCARIRRYVETCRPARRRAQA